MSDPTNIPEAPEAEKPAPEVKLHTTDQTLIDAAKTGEGLVEITPEMFKGIGRRVDAENAKLDAIEDTVAAIPYEQRLAVAGWVFKHVVAHAKEGGSYRYLIYKRLGFGPDAYVPLYLAGGMEISNHFDLTEPEAEHD